MQTIKKEKTEAPSNTETRELFLDASANEPPAERMLAITEEEEETEGSQQAPDDEQT